MRFLVDAQPPPASARWLAAQGYQADHVADLNMNSAPDSSIWQLAASTGAVIVTKDEDFAIWRMHRTGSQSAVSGLAAFG